MIFLNTLLISYGIKEYDGRLTEIRKIANELGKATIVCVGISESNNPNEKIVKLNNSKYLSTYIYISFLVLCLKTAHEMKDIDVLFSDNLFSAIPALLIKLLYNPKSIIQDVRELYFSKDLKSLVGKLFVKFEITLMKKADIVLCANEQRSKIMYEEHNLSKYPMVFENVRFLTGEYDKDELDEKYKYFFNYKINIVSTGGLSVLRTTDKLVMAMSRLPSDFGLYIIGGGTNEDSSTILNIIESSNLKNVYLIHKVSLSELRYIIQQCDIGIVNYHKNDLNNMYCASGKIYEYLAEGLPIVTTENIPLKEFCEMHKVGEADDFFYNGILKVSKNIDEYKKRVNSFISGVSVESYNAEIANKILETIKCKDTGNDDKIME